jgi:hypothetical protein
VSPLAYAHTILQGRRREGGAQEEGAELEVLIVGSLRGKVTGA